jgi:hypothetical protein
MMLSNRSLQAVVLVIYLGSAYLVNVEVKEPYLVRKYTRIVLSFILADKM